MTEGNQEVTPDNSAAAAAIGQLDLKDDSAVLQFGNERCQNIERLYARQAQLRKELDKVRTDIEADESAVRAVVGSKKVSAEAAAYVRKRLARTVPKPPSKAARG